VSDACGQVGRRHEAPDTLDEVSVEGPKGSYVKGANPASFFGSHRFEDGKESGLGLACPGGRHDQDAGACLNSMNCVSLHPIEPLNAGLLKESAHRNVFRPWYVQRNHKALHTGDKA
jgi:hypothetical protein